MGTLRDKLSDPATKTRVIDDAIKTIDAEVSDKGGLGGMAIKAAYSMVKGVAPGIMNKLLANMLPDFLDAVQPFHDQAVTSNTLLKELFAKRSSEVANALLSVTDSRAAKADAGALKKGYEKLRPSAQKHVEQALPRLADLVKNIAG